MAAPSVGPTVAPADVLSRGERTCLLLCDVQATIMAGVFGSENPSPVVTRMAELLERSRAAGLSTGFVAVQFREGHPEVAPTSKLFSRIKGAGKLLMSDPDAAIDTRIAPLASEPVFVKRRVGAFSSTDLESFLRAKGVDTIVLAGFSTSGVILSTLCWAADRDFRVVVLADLCADSDKEVHSVLTSKVFAKQAHVMTSAEVLEA